MQTTFNTSLFKCLLLSLSLNLFLVTCGSDKVKFSKSTASGSASTAVKPGSKPSEEQANKKQGGNSNGEEIGKKSGGAAVGEQFDLPSPPKLLNMAILTRSVQCFYCHLRIEGDVGGINFPTQGIRGDTGKGLKILGTLYATNKIPDLIGKAADKTVENYRNEELPVFPKSLDTQGVPTFPTITAAQISAGAKGSVTAASGTFSKIIQGNAQLVGTQAAPIVLNGEVYFTGDVVIKGVYKGIGTIYARRIFIADDLTAQKSVFPYPLDPAAAIVQAKADLAAKKDALYLYSMSNVVVGWPENRLSGTIEKELLASDPSAKLDDGPWTWLPKAQYKQLGVDAAKKFPGKCNNSSDVEAMEVNKVEAFIYAANALSWRSCSPMTLNGGFVAPAVAFVSSKSGDNPDNQNVIRYDYRLRVGISGFDAVKPFFE